MFDGDEVKDVVTIHSGRVTTYEARVLYRNQPHRIFSVWRDGDGFRYGESAGESFYFTEFRQIEKILPPEGWQRLETIFSIESVTSLSMQELRIECLSELVHA